MPGTAQGTIALINPKPYTCPGRTLIMVATRMRGTDSSGVMKSWPSEGLRIQGSASRVEFLILGRGGEIRVQKIGFDFIPRTQGSIQTCPGRALGSG